MAVVLPKVPKKGMRFHTPGSKVGRQVISATSGGATCDSRSLNESPEQKQLKKEMAAWNASVAKAKAIKKLKSIAKGQV